MDIRKYFLPLRKEHAVKTIYKAPINIKMETNIKIEFVEEEPVELHCTDTIDVIPNIPPIIGDVVWKKNFFSLIQDIYEPRGPKYNCSECGDIFCTRLSLLTHSKMHLKPFCVICPIYVETKTQMNVHMTLNHPNLICDKKDVVKIEENIISPSTSKEIDASNKKRKRPRRASRKSLNFETEFVGTRTSRFGRNITVKLRDY